MIDGTARVGAKIVTPVVIGVKMKVEVIEDTATEMHQLISISILLVFQAP
jgi:hypothetical protein